MKKIFCLLLLISFLSLTAHNTFPADTQWTVVGAGPAGIISVGLLLELGVPANEITWVDPEFNVGRLGKYYTNVPANVPTKVFIDFILSCKAFRECMSPEIISLLHDFDPSVEHPLWVIVNPLRAITRHLRTQVSSYQSHIKNLTFENNVWHVNTTQQRFSSGHVILASGSHPKELGYNCAHVIPLDSALDFPTLKTLVTPDDSIAVVGSAHSAILILKFLCELNVKQIINFYKHDPIFDHDDAGLGGITAQWAKNVLLTAPPPNLQRVYNTPAALEEWISSCNKIIYACGFERNEVPAINGETDICYDAMYGTILDKSGNIAPRLFGIGIAFPETVDYMGHTIAKINLESFMEYAQRVMPTWLASKQGRLHLASFAQLFSIHAL